MTSKGWAGVALAGLAFGVLTSVLNHAGRGPVGAISAVVGGGAAWACVLVAAAWWTARGESSGNLWLRGMATAVVVALTAVVGYYLSDFLIAWAQLGRRDADLPPEMRQGLSSLVADSLGDVAYWGIGAVISGVALGLVGAATHRRGLTGLLARLVAPTGLLVWGVAMVMTERAVQPDPWRVAAFGASAVVGLSLTTWFLVTAAGPRGMHSRTRRLPSS